VQQEVVAAVDTQTVLCTNNCRMLLLVAAHEGARCQNAMGRGANHQAQADDTLNAEGSSDHGDADSHAVHIDKTRVAVGGNDDDAAHSHIHVEEAGNGQDMEHWTHTCKGGGFLVWEASHCFHYDCCIHSAPWVGASKDPNPLGAASFETSEVPIQASRPWFAPEQLQEQQVELPVWPCQGPDEDWCCRSERSPAAPALEVEVQDAALFFWQSRTLEVTWV